MRKGGEGRGEGREGEGRRGKDRTEEERSGETENNKACGKIGEFKKKIFGSYFL